MKPTHYGFNYLSEFQSRPVKEGRAAVLQVCFQELHLSRPLCLLALPIIFKQKLKNVQVEEGRNITLCCEISKPGAPGEWRLGGDLLEHGDKYQIKQRGAVLELSIRDAVPEDSGVYTCVCREQRTKSTVKVIGESVPYLVIT